MNGGNALPDQDTQTGEYRDEFACTCLQFETGYEHHGCPAVTPGDTGIAPGFAL